MLISSWLRVLKSSRSRFSRRHTNRRHIVNVPAHVERLEDRILLSGTGSGDHHEHRPFFETQYLNDSPFVFTWDAEAAETAETEGAAAQASSALSSLVSLPALHSNPGASASLFLDFDGHFEPVWGAYTDLTTPVYDVDGDDTTFSDGELANIDAIWARVAEDFAPFNVDVTTVEPAVLAEGVPIDDANGVAMRVAIGGSWQDWFGSSAGGVAYIDVFTNSIANVVYAFSDNLGSAKNIAEVSSHEAGHGLGLSHQSVYDANGVKTAEYNPGDGYWAPIMGVAYSATVSTWNNGTSSQGSTVFQDDMAILAGTTNGFGFRSDDHGDTSGAATALFTGGMSIAGIIEENDDVDVFAFSASVADSYSLSVDVAAVGPNLDVVLELYDAIGVLIDTADPQHTLGAEIISSLAAGDYFLHVSKIDTYGWVGEYSVSVVGGAGPKVESMSPIASVSGPQASTRVVFANALDPASFSTADVAITDAFNASLSVVAVNVVPGSDNREFDLVFASSDPGNYTISIGPDVQDTFGHLMNQDGDDVNGELVEDVFNGTLIVPQSGWTFDLSSSGNNPNSNILVGPDGHIYVVGVFAGTVDFDPGPDSSVLTSRIGGDDGFIAKYTRDQQLLWVRRFGGDSSDKGRDVQVDQADNVYVTGDFTGSADFGPVTLQSSNASKDVFLAKLDSGGKFLWAHELGGTDSDTTGAIALSDTGDVYVAGSIRETADFDPDPNSSFLLSSAGLRDGFIWKLDSAGSFQNAVLFEGVDEGRLTRIGLDGSGNVYVSGLFRGAIDLGTTVGGQTLTLTSAGNLDTFVVKLDSNLQPEWARQVAGPGLEDNQGVAVDSAGFVYFVSGFQQSIDLSGAAILTSAGLQDTLVAKYNTAGDLLWVKQLTGSEDVNSNQVQLDGDGNPHLAGWFKGTSDFDPDAGTHALTSAGDRDGFVLKMDASTGALTWVRQFSSNARVTGWSVAIDNAGSVYSTGNFRGEMISPTGDELGTASIANFIARLDMAPGVGVTPITNLRTSEDGTQAQFGIVLTTRPTADVTVPLSSSDLTEGTISVGSVTFTPSDWNVPQLITVTGVDDAVLDDDVFYNVVLGPAVSSDSDYSNLDAPDILFLNRDNDSTQSSFSSTDVPKTLKDAKGKNSGKTNSTLAISDAFNILDLNVQLDLSHTWNEDLDVFLISPAGTRVELFTDVGGSFDNFTDTILDDQASTPITAGTAPFTGTFQPEGLLSDFNGESTSGIWTLEIQDDEKFEVGTLNSWSITVTHPVPGPSMPSVSIDDVSVNEGDAGTTTAVFTVSLSEVAAENVIIDFATQDDTATASSDYVAASGSALIPAGLLSTTVSITINGDTDDEGNETYFVNLSNVSANAIIADNQGVGTITDDDAVGVTVSSISPNNIPLDGKKNPRHYHRQRLPHRC